MRRSGGGGDERDRQKVVEREKWGEIQRRRKRERERDKERESQRQRERERESQREREQGEREFESFYLITVSKEADCLFSFRR